MTENSNNENPLFTDPLVYRLPHSGEVREGIRYGDDSRTLDIYLPGQSEGLAPAVLLITGYPDPGYEAFAGRKQMQIQAYRDWAELLAASGIAVVLYSNVEPVEDAQSLLDYVRLEAAQLQIDAQRIGILACSGNVPNALHLLHSDGGLRCAAFLYGFMLDTAESKSVDEMSKTFRFANPNSGMDNFPENTPILVIGAGKDEFPGLNESIDNFEAEAVARNSPVSVIRYPEGVHGFDILDDSRRSVEMIKLVVGFLRLRLNVY